MIRRLSHDPYRPNALGVAAMPRHAEPQQPVDRLVRFGVYVIAFYIFVKMFYVFSGGSSQPSDILLGLTAILFCSPRVVMNFVRKNVLQAVLVAWIVSVNLVWFAWTRKDDFALSSLFYIFNTMVLIAVYACRSADTETFDKYAKFALKSSFVVQFAIVLIFYGAGRALGTFNNPNQLAYWGITTLSMFLMLTYGKNSWKDVPFVLMPTYCVLASQSRAGVAACAALFLIWTLQVTSTWHRRVLAMALFVVAGMVIVQTGGAGRFLSSSDAASRFEERMTTRDSGDITSDRNYDRITEFYQYTIVGAGEGLYERFEEGYGQAMEIHSSFATMLFSYGIVGLVFFLAFLGNILLRVPWTIAAYLVPSLIYSVTHHGLRFTFFWMLIAIMITYGEMRRDKTSSDKRQAIGPTVGVWQPRTAEYLRSMAKPVDRLGPDR